MIDLHLHTSASDGSLPPERLVDRLASVGISACSVTDHDTVAAIDAAAEAAARRSLRFLSGIEITAIDAGRDVHVLGYGIDPRSTTLEAFLAIQREARRLRIHRILERLDQLGMPLDKAHVLALAIASAGVGSTRGLGRPHVARAMVEAGYVPTITEAFGLWLGSGCPAFVERSGATPAEVVATIHLAGGIASLAHPGLTNRDALIPALADAGLDAIEVWHSEHDEAATSHYAGLASRLGLLMTGGSDFHGDASGRVCRLGEVGVPEDAFAALLARLSPGPRTGAPIAESGGVVSTAGVGPAEAGGRP